ARRRDRLRGAARRSGRPGGRHHPLLPRGARRGFRRGGGPREAQVLLGAHGRGRGVPGRGGPARGGDAVNKRAIALDELLARLAAGEVVPVEFEDWQAWAEALPIVETVPSAMGGD